MQQLFDALASGIASALGALYSVIPDYAVVIAILTLLIMIATTPLTLKSTRSMMLMQQLQPEIKRLQSQFKDDRQRLNEEIMKFYRENNLSPAGGCVPMLVQMPVFAILYQVLRGLTRREPDLGFSSGIGLAGNSGKAPDLHLPFDPAFLDHTSKLYQSLRGTSKMLSFGIDLSQTCAEALASNIVTALPFIVMIGVVGYTSWYQQKQIQGRNPNAQMDPTQQTLMKVMPFMLPAFSFVMPAGLVLYFMVSNLYRVGLQGYISRSIYGIGKDGGAASAAPPAKAGGKSEKAAKAAKPAGSTPEGKAAGRAVASNGGGSAKGGGAAGKAKVADGGPSEGGGRSGGRGSGTQERSKGTAAKPARDASQPSGGPGGAPGQPRARKPKKR